jgi:DNA-binding helix-hairpin-helix protein with protein kinase domain
MALVNERGEIVKLGREITTPGGEGSIHEVADNATWVAKIYHSPPPLQKSRKLEFLRRLGNKSLQSVAAWPASLLFSNNDRQTVRGFVMPRMNGKEIHRLYGPRDRHLEFPTADWEFLTHVARNCAAAFETLHENGVVMADVNEKNLLVTNNGEVRLIDCDSYQIKNGNGYFHCDVGVPLWTPPELQAQVNRNGYAGLERTPNHDRFGLAVLIFELLFMGRHPFAGVPISNQNFEIHEAIQRYLFAFSPQTLQRGVKSPPHTLPLSAIPKTLVQLFDRSFLPLSDRPNARPTGREWAHELESLRTALKKCQFDPGHKYWNALSSCPWCQLLSGGGPNFFISVAIHSGTDGTVADVTIYWNIICRITTGDLMKKNIGSFPLPILKARPMPMARPVPPKLSRPQPPIEPTPLPKPALLPPNLPNVPQMLPPAPIPSFPLGTGEQEARLSGVGASLFLLACFVSVQLQLAEAAIFAGIAVIIFLATWFVKSNQAAQERNIRREAIRLAKETERVKAEELHAIRLKEHEIEAKRIQDEHAEWVAKAESGYLRAKANLESQYRSQLSAYSAELGLYENAFSKYENDKAQWEKECKSRALLADQSKREMEDNLQRLRSIVVIFQENVRNLKYKVDAAYQQFQKANSSEIADIQALEAKKREAQLRQFLDAKLINYSRITGIGAVKAATLIAYGFESALDITPTMQVAGIGPVLRGNLLAWRLKCESEFRFNQNTPIPQSEIRAIKLRYAQARQAALIEIRAGAERMSSWETETRRLSSSLELKIPQLARVYAQAAADKNACS